VSTAEQYRAKAVEMNILRKRTPCSPQETRKLRNLERTYITFAENEEWLAINIDKTVQR
jgi:hypothetical protein